MKRALGVLSQLREQQLDESQLELGQRREQTRVAGQNVSRLRGQSAQERCDEARAITQEHERGAGGELRASDLHALTGYSFGVQKRLVHLAAAQSSAEQELVQHHDAEKRARCAVVTAQVQAQAVSKRLDQLEHAASAARESAAEEDGTETFIAGLSRFKK